MGERERKGEKGRRKGGEGETEKRRQNLRFGESDTDVEFIVSYPKVRPI